MLASYWAQNYFLCPNTDKHSHEPWNQFIKRSIPGAFLLIFSSPFYLTQLTAPGSLRVSPFMRPFWSFVESRAKKPQNSQGPKCPSQIRKSAVIGLRFSPLVSTDVRWRRIAWQAKRTSSSPVCGKLLNFRLLGGPFDCIFFCFFDLRS